VCKLCLRRLDLRRVNFCEWILQMNAQDPTFIEKNMFTDEANYSRNGKLNLRNLHYWSVENPHLYRSVHHQHRFSINVWTGIIQNEVVGPFILPNRLTGNDYLLFLRNDFENYLDEIPLEIRRYSYTCLMLDGAPPNIHHHIVYFFVRTLLDGQKWTNSVASTLTGS
jgi:hypothetical protein